MPNPLASFLGRLSAPAQIAWLHRQPPEVLVGLHARYGYGAAECDCPVRWLPCAEHSLSRFQMIARLSSAHGAVEVYKGQECFMFDRGLARIPWRGNLLASIAALPDRRLFWALFPEFKNQKGCDCPAVCEPCEHYFAPFDSPLTRESRDELARLVEAAELVEPPEPIDPTYCGTTKTKCFVMAERRDEGFGIWHRQDFLQRSLVPHDWIDRDAENLRNGALCPGEVRLKGTAA